LRQISKTKCLEYGDIADIMRFKQLGGEVIMIQGLNDVAVAPGFTRNSYERFGQVIGNESENFMRFNKSLGVNHVSGYLQRIFMMC
jgi:hypothetical protein